MNKILITGGLGFIGTNLIIKLLENKDNNILNIDKFSYSSNLYYKKRVYSNLKSVKLNLLNFKKLENLIKKFKPNIVFHLAAETHVDVSINNPAIHYDNNTKATLNLLMILQSAYRKNILDKKFKFVHIGTDEIYGDLDFNSKKSFDENQPLDPNNPYSASKAAAVMMVKSWHKNFNFPCIITNSVNNFGPFQFIEKFIPRSILLGLNNKHIEVYGKGQNIRSWISVQDHVDALIYLSKKGKIGETYNISSGHKLSNLDLAKKIKQILRDKGFNTRVKFVTDRLGHDRQYSINCNKILKLGWKPKALFGQELTNTINWYLDKKNLYNFKNIKHHLTRKGIIK